MKNVETISRWQLVGMYLVLRNPQAWGEKFEVGKFITTK